MLLSSRGIFTAPPNVPSLQCLMIKLGRLCPPDRFSSHAVKTGQTQIRPIQALLKIIRCITATVQCFCCHPH